MAVPVVTFISHFIYHRIWFGSENFSVFVPFIIFTMAAIWKKKLLFTFHWSFTAIGLLSNVHVTHSHIQPPKIQWQIIQFSERNTFTCFVCLYISFDLTLALSLWFSSFYTIKFVSYLLMTKLNAFHCQSTKCHDSDLIRIIVLGLTIQFEWLWMHEFDFHKSIDFQDIWILFVFLCSTISCVWFITEGRVDWIKLPFFCLSKSRPNTIENGLNQLMNNFSRKKNFTRK